MADFDLKQSLTTKLGPLPAWVWAAIPAGGYVIYAYLRRGSEGEEADEVGTNLPGEEDDFTTDYSNLPGYPDFPDGTLPRRPEPEPYDNEDWRQDAIKWAIGQGRNPLNAVAAVDSYLYQRPPTLNTGQMEVLRAILAFKGPAPTGGTIPPLTGGTPSPSPKTEAPKPPTNVSLRLARGRVEATWGPSATANVRYEVERRIDNGPWRLISVTQQRAVSFESGKFTNTVRVRSRNLKGYSAYATSNPLKVLQPTG